MRANGFAFDRRIEKDRRRLAGPEAIQASLAGGADAAVAETESSAVHRYPPLLT